MRGAAPVSKDMKELIRVFAQITLLRRGPQDLPASPLLTVLSIVAYLAVNFVIATALPPGSGWPMQLLIGALFTLLWYIVVLRLVGRPERIPQTVSAVFGLETLLSPPLIVCEWLMRRFGTDTTWQLPIAVVGLLLVIWLIAANAHVVCAALEWSLAASVALVILRIVATELLLIALFAPANT